MFEGFKKELKYEVEGVKKFLKGDSDEQAMCGACVFGAVVGVGGFMTGELIGEAIAKKMSSKKVRERKLAEQKVDMARMNACYNTGRLAGERDAYRDIALNNPFADAKIEEVKKF